MATKNKTTKAKPDRPAKAKAAGALSNDTRTEAERLRGREVWAAMSGSGFTFDAWSLFDRIEDVRKGIAVFLHKYPSGADALDDVVANAGFVLTKDERKNWLYRFEETVENLEGFEWAVRRVLAELDSEVIPHRPTEEVARLVRERPDLDTAGKCELLVSGNG